MRGQGQVDGRMVHISVLVHVQYWQFLCKHMLYGIWGGGGFKGSLTREFRLQEFFMNQYPPGRFEFFVENLRSYSGIIVYHRHWQ
jgi:hypothetical protein